MTEKIKNIACRVLYLLSKITGYSKMRISILGYHSVSGDDTLIDITQEDFKSQIEYLIENNYTFVTLEKAVRMLKAGKPPKNPVAVLTFDDGYADLLTQVVPFLTSKNIPATYFVITEEKKVDREKLQNRKKLLNLKGIDKLASYRGTDIEGHTRFHDDLSDKSPDQVAEDVLHAKETLEKNLKRKVKLFAYPWGRYSNNYIEGLKKAKYMAACTTEPGDSFNSPDTYHITRIMVDRTHTLEQFKFMMTPLYPVVMKFKQKYRPQKLLYFFQSTPFQFGIISK